MARFIPDRRASVLVVAGGANDHAVLKALGFSNVVISNLDQSIRAHDFAPYDWELQDASALTYDDQSFDFVVIHAGLHHCSAPHKALTEMYRVARVGSLVIEARDSAVMRLLVRLRLVTSYECSAVHYCDGMGGVDNTSIPNYVYRWTEREVEKTISSYAPHVRHNIRFDYGSSMPTRLGRNERLWRRLLVRAGRPVYEVLAALLPRQQNLFAFYIPKPAIPDELQPWLVASGGEIGFDREWGERKFLPRDEADVLYDQQTRGVARPPSRG